MRPDDPIHSPPRPFLWGAYRLGWLLLLAGALTAFCLRPAQADITVDALVGFGQSSAATARYRPDTWTPITVFLTGQGVRGVGQLTVTARQGQRTLSYTRRVSLHEGPLNETQGFVFELQPTDIYNRGNAVTELHIQLVMDGRELARKKVTLPIATNAETFNILALTRDGSGLNFLSKKKLGLYHRGFNPVFVQQRFGGNFNGNNNGATSVNGVDQQANTQVLYTDPRALPGMAQGYAMMDAVALADQPLDNLTEDQIEAIRGFVRMGGTLVIAGGGDLSRLKSQFYNEMLPIQPTGSRAVQDVPELRKRYQQPIALNGSVALTEGTLKPEARVLLAAEGSATPLISMRPYGSGVVVFTAFDYLAPEFRGWKQAPSLWRDLLRCSNHAVSPRALLAAQMHNNPYGGGNNNTMLADALAGKQATNAPEWYMVAIFLAAYIVLLVPVSYFILKKIDKREFAWVTAPLIIIGFSVTSYIMALSIKGGALTVNRAVVLETLANSDQVAGYAHLTLYSPQRSRYDIAFGPASDPNSPFRTVVPGELLPANDAGPAELAIDHDQTTYLRGAEVHLWDKRSFDTPVVAHLGGPVQITTKMMPDNVTLHIAVTNKTKHTLKDCTFVNDTQTVPLGDLAPGETKETDDRKERLHWAKHDAAIGLHLPFAVNATPPNQVVSSAKVDTPEETRNKIRYALTQALAADPNQNNNWYADGGSSFGHATNALVGWFSDEQPTLPIEVSGKKANGEEVNLLFVHLPPPANAVKNVAELTNPFRQLPVLNLLDEQGPGAPQSGGIFR